MALSVIGATINILCFLSFFVKIFPCKNLWAKFCPISTASIKSQNYTCGPSIISSATKCWNASRIIIVLSKKIIAFNPDDNIAEINRALCKGCGNCAAACPSEAIVLKGFDNHQLYAQIKEAFAA